MSYAHLHSQVHPIQETMVHMCSVWPTLSVWCIKFQIEGPSLFAIPRYKNVRKKERKRGTTKKERKKERKKEGKERKKERKRGTRM